MMPAAPLPIATGVTPSGPHPFLLASSFVSQSVSEPALEMPIFLPLSSSTDLIGESHGTPMPRKGNGPANSQTASMGTPLATSAISVPAPSPISRAPAAMAWAILLPPAKSDDFQVEPVFLEDAELVADIDGNDRVRVRRRLADGERRRRGRGRPGDDRSEGERECARENGKFRHDFPLLFLRYPYFGR